MPISEIRSILGKFYYDSEKTTDFTVVAAAITSDHFWKNETVEYWVLPENNNAKAIFCLLPWTCKTPPPIQEAFDCEFGLVSDGLRGFSFENLQEQLAANMKAVSVKVAGDEAEWGSKGYRVSLHLKLMVIDERQPVRPELLTSMNK